MITFRDMTFCDSWDECVDGDNCPRAITEDVLIRAREVGLPLSVTDKFDCFKSRDVKK